MFVTQPTMNTHCLSSPILNPSHTMKIQHKCMYLTCRSSQAHWTVESCFRFNSNSIPNKSPVIQELYLIVLGTQLFNTTIVHLRCKYQNTNTRTWLQGWCNVRNIQCISRKIYLIFETLCWSKFDEVRKTHSDDVIKVVKTFKRLAG